jgi:hypothetical protein
MESKPELGECVPVVLDPAFATGSSTGTIFDDKSILADVRQVETSSATRR